MNIRVCTLDKAEGITVEDLFNLHNASVQQWRDIGLDGPYVKMTIERFARSLKNRTVIVATDKDTGKLVGMRSLRFDWKNKCVFENHLNVLPEVKRCGVASRIIEAETEYIRKAGITHTKCATAVPAVWSKRWHLKKGYLIIGYSRNEYDNFPSYQFRRQIAPSLLWSGPLAPAWAKAHYIVRRVADIVLRDTKGRPNRLYHILKKLLRRNT